MKTLAKVFAGLVLGVLLLAVLLVTLLWWRPGWILNDINLARAQSYLQHHGQKVSWSNGHLEASSLSFWDKEIRLYLSNFCFSSTDDSLHTCLDSAAIAARADLYWKGPRLTVIGPIHIQGRELIYRPAAEAPKPAPANKGEGGIPYWLERAQIRDVTFRTPWKFTPNKGEALSGLASLEGGSLNKGVHWQGVITLKSQSQSAKLAFNAANPVSPWTIENWDADVDAAWKSAPQMATLKGTLRRIGMAGGHVDLRASYKKSKLSAEGKLLGAIRRDAAEATIDAKVKGLNPRLRLIELGKCHLAAAWKPNEMRDAALDVSQCNTWLTLADLRRFAEQRKVRVASRLGLAWNAKFNSFVSPTPENPLRANLNIKLDSLPNELVDLKGSAEATIRAEAYEAKAINASAKANLEGLVTSFQTLVKALARNSVTIPAPLHVLNGRIKMSLQGEGDLREHGFKVPFRVETFLVSQEQRFKTLTSGELLLPPQPEGAAKTLPDLKVDISLNDVSLVLPRLELKAPPPMMPDARIHKIEDESVAKKSPPLRYTVRVFTPKGQPLHLKSNLVSTPVPLDIDVRAESGRPPYGFVAVRDYPMELFRRKANIKNFVLDLKGERELDGKINFTLPQYTIQMLVMGTLGRPQIQFISDPPLAPEEITAVLIFGKPIQALDANGRASAAGVGAALANGAIGLASLYFLASTPIENINYNSGTGEVIAQLGVGKGTSLSIGATSEQIESVGLTKRLGKNWQLSTQVSNPQNLETASLRSVLEWFKRY